MRTWGGGHGKRDAKAPKGRLPSAREPLQPPPLVLALLVYGLLLLAAVA